MPRFERIIPAVPARKGVNPFTRQTLEIAGIPASTSVFEIEQQGAVLHFAQGEAGSERSSKRTFATEDAATTEYHRLIKRKLRQRFVASGAARILTPGDTSPAGGPRDDSPPPSFLWLEQAFASEDDRFVSELFRFRKVEQAASFAKNWLTDTRPFARRALLAYVDDGCDRSGHKALVKRLFKQADQAGDDELMGHFMVAFDRLVTRTRIVRYGVGSFATDPSLRVRLDEGGTSDQFSIATRSYLARRAFRYFRRLGRRDVDRYGRAMRHTLSLYRDEHLSKPMRLLDAWGLAHALYASSTVLEFRPKGIRVAAGESLESLRPAPFLPEAFSNCFGELVPLVAGSHARPVRRFFKELLETNHKHELAALTLPELRGLLSSPHEEAQELGAALLKTAKGAERLTVEQWLALLDTPSPEIVALLCEAIAQHVAPSRLSLAQACELACQKRAPVAELGLAWALGKPLQNEEDLRIATTLGRATVEPVRKRAADHLRTKLVELSFAKPEHLRELVDAPHADVRAVGLELLASEPKFSESAMLWWALSESPWKDVRAFATKHTKRWLQAKDEHAAPKTAQFFATTMLSIHGGSKAKRNAMRDVTAHAIRPSKEAPQAEVLALVRHVARSVRPAERAMALAALARALRLRPELADTVRELLPEVSFSGVTS